MTTKKTKAALNHDDIADGRIVSSRHLVSERCAELSELEYALIMTSNAFNKWMVRCMTAAGEPDMGAFDVSLLHHVNHRNRKKKLADICFVLNVEDTHVVTYALKKLVKAGYVTSLDYGQMHGALTLTGIFRQQTGARVKRYIAGTVRRRNAMWSCSRATNRVPSPRLRRCASLFIRSTRPG